MTSIRITEAMELTKWARAAAKSRFFAILAQTFNFALLTFNFALPIKEAAIIRTSLDS